MYLYIVCIHKFVFKANLHYVHVLTLGTLIWDFNFVPFKNLPKLPKTLNINFTTHTLILYGAVLL